MSDQYDAGENDDPSLDCTQEEIDQAAYQAMLEARWQDEQIRVYELLHGVFAPAVVQGTEEPF
jgi:hypothetical protein